MVENWPYSDRPQGYHSGTGKVRKMKWGALKCSPFMLNNYPKVVHGEPGLNRIFEWDKK